MCMTDKLYVYHCMVENREQEAHLSFCGQNWDSCLYLHYSLGSEFSQAEGRQSSNSLWSPSMEILQGICSFFLQRLAEVAF